MHDLTLDDAELREPATAPGDTGAVYSDSVYPDIAAPDRTEAEPAPLRATRPMHASEFAAPPDARDLGPDGLLGTVVDRKRLFVGDAVRRAPDVALVESLCELSVGSGSLEALDDAELRHVVAGWERVVSWARAAQARVARELMARTGDVLSRDSAAGEMSGAMHVTTSEAWQIAVRGEGTGRFPALAEALAEGRVDARKTDVFLRAGAELTFEERGEAIDDLLPLAPRHTWKWLSEQLNARAARLHGRRARRRDVTDRCNVWAEQAGPGRGRLVADLPVVDAAVTFDAVQAAAKALKDVPGETRPLGALRAAAFAALVTGRVVLPCLDDVEKGADVAAGAGTSAAQPPRLVEPLLDTDVVPVPDDPDGVHLTRPVAPVGTRVRTVDVPATVHVTVSAAMLLDPDDDTPGFLEGIGPIPADDAARIAADGTWRRLLTDPESGILRDYSTRAYSPGVSLRAAVAARDRTCTFPGCDRPGVAGGRVATDLDHIAPFRRDHRYSPDEPGQTRARNLHLLCRRHHNLKTHGNWRVARDPGTGVTRWIAPTGTRDDVDPAVVDPVVRYGLGLGLTPAPAGTVGDARRDPPVGNPEGRNPGGRNPGGRNPGGGESDGGESDGSPPF